MTGNRVQGMLLLAGLLAFAIQSAFAGDTRPDTKAAADVLIAAYPDFLTPSKNPALIQWRDGCLMALDNGIVKTSFEDLLNRASILDQISVHYPQGWPFDKSLIATDPGRVRNEAFFRRMYGDSRISASAHLTDVPWPSADSLQKVRFTSVNGAAQALAAVRDDINKQGPDAVRLVSKTSGTFTWRVIAGTQRLSMHSFGAAIDFDLPNGLGRYWRWDKKDGDGYPSEVLNDKTLGAVVLAFEKHGFIWGGKWGHYDTVHFEYRPELLSRDDANSRRLAQSRNPR